MASSRVKVSPDGQYVLSTGIYAPERLRCHCCAGVSCAILLSQLQIHASTRRALFSGASYIRLERARNEMLSQRTYLKSTLIYGLGYEICRDASLVWLNSRSGRPSEQPGTPFCPNLSVCVCAGSIEVAWIRRLWTFSCCPRIGRSLPLTKTRGSNGKCFKLRQLHAKARNVLASDFHVAEITAFGGGALLVTLFSDDIQIFTVLSV